MCMVARTIADEWTERGMRNAAGVAGRLALLVGLLLGACAVPGGGRVVNTTGGQSTGNPGHALQARLIVKFRAGSESGQSTDKALQRLDAIAPSGVRFAWERRLGVGADLFVASRPLDEGEIRSLMQQLQAAQDVEYAEPDSLMTIDPVRPRELRGEPD